MNMNKKMKAFFDGHDEDYALLLENDLENSGKKVIFDFLFKKYYSVIGFENTIKKLNYFSIEIKYDFLKTNYEVYKNDIKNLINEFVYLDEMKSLKLFLSGNIKTCPICGRMHLKLYSSFCCNRCAQLNPETKNKVKQTKLERYGNANYNNSDAIKKTKLEKYGDSGFTNREKCRHTVRERYGVDNIFQDENTIKKLKQTKLEKYGDENYNNREQAEATCLAKYGCTNCSFSGIIKEKISNSLSILNNHKDANKEFIENNFIKEGRFLIRECCEYFNVCITTMKKFKKKIGITNKNKKYYRYSKMQQFIFDTIDHKNKEMNVHNLLNGNLEIDIFIPDLNIGVEYNGLYYHKYNQEKFLREYKKFLISEQHGIKLCQIYECDNVDLWIYKISHLVGKSKRIFARKCILKELSYNEIHDFTDANSLDNFFKDNYGQNGFGLFYFGELVSILTFTKNEVNQICTKRGYCIVGGLSKMIKNYERCYNKSYVIKHNNKFGLTNVFKYAGKYTTKYEEPSIIETSKFDFADCGKTIYIRTEQDE